MVNATRTAPMITMAETGRNAAQAGVTGEHISGGEEQDNGYTIGDASARWASRMNMKGMTTGKVERKTRRRRQARRANSGGESWMSCRWGELF
jgi:hypothetical protein